MLRLLAALIIIVLAPRGLAQCPADWLFTTDGAGEGSTQFIHELVTDPQGDIYALGDYIGECPIGAVVLPDTASRFLAKSNAQGQLLWVRAGGSTGQQMGYYPSGMVVDGQGHVIYTGVQFYPAHFGPFTAPQSPGSFVQGYVASYTAEGEPVWMTPLRGTGEVLVVGIVLDPRTGLLQVAGSFGGVPDFAPEGLTVQGERDLFIVSLDASTGAVVHTAFFGSEGWDICSGLAIAPDAALYMTGSFNGDWLVGDSVEVPHSGTLGDAMLVRVDADTITWLQRATSDVVDFFRDVDATADGRICVALDLRGQARVAGEPIFVYGEADAGMAVFLAENGALQWVRTGGGNGLDAATSVRYDATAHRFRMVGVQEEAGWFGPLYLSGGSGRGAFRVAYDDEGNVVTGDHFDTDGINSCNALAVAADGSVYTGGGWRGQGTIAGHPVTTGSDTRAYLVPWCDVPIGLAEVARPLPFSVHPDPVDAGGMFIVDLGDRPTPAELVVRDACGRVVRSEHLCSGKSVLSSAGLAPGCYLVCAGDGSGSAVRRLVVR